MNSRLNTLIAGCLDHLQQNPEAGLPYERRLEIYNALGPEKWDLDPDEELSRDQERALTQESKVWFDKATDIYLEETTIGHRRRACLAIKSVSLLCPFWRSYCAEDNRLPVGMWTAHRILAGEVSVQLGQEVSTLLFGSLDGYYDSPSIEARLQGASAEWGEAAKEWFASLCAAVETEQEIAVVPPEKELENLDLVKEEIIRACSGMLEVVLQDEYYDEDTSLYEWMEDTEEEPASHTAIAFCSLQNALKDPGDDPAPQATFWRWWLTEAVPSAFDSLEEG